MGVQWSCNSELIVALISANICYSLITMLVIYDDFVTMWHRDLVGWDNRGTQGVRLGQRFPSEPVSD